MMPNKTQITFPDTAVSVTVPQATDTWTAAGMSDVADLFARIDRALEQLERGLPL